MVDFELAYKTLFSKTDDYQRKIDIDSPIGIYYGHTRDGYFRLAFLTKQTTAQLMSTEVIRVSQYRESGTAFWTNFDLLSPEVLDTFCVFCADMVSAVANEASEANAIQKLRRRYIAWKAMFSKSTGRKVSREVLQGLYGELYFLKNYMIPKFGSQTAIDAWGGPISLSKDYSVSNTWYEIKTIGANSAIIKISSLAQLSSSVDGHLVVIRVEQLADASELYDSSVTALIEEILRELKDENVASSFITKLSNLGLDFDEEAKVIKFDVKSMQAYLVNDKFPCLKEDLISSNAVKDVSYSLIISGISDYKEELA